GGGGLQLEVERHAEALPEREAPRAVDAAAERRVHDELHAAGLVEEAFGDDTALRGHRAEDRTRFGEVADDLLGAVGGEPALGREPVDRGTPVGEPRHHVAAERRHGGRQLARTGGRLAEPERNGGRRAGRSRPCTRSKWTSAPRRPRRVATPSASMSMTASKSSRESRRKPYARRTRAQSSSTPISPVAIVAAHCWARTSSGFSGTLRRSSSPARTARTAAAACTRSSRVRGKNTPRGTA